MKCENEAFREWLLGRPSSKCRAEESPREQTSRPKGPRLTGRHEARVANWPAAGYGQYDETLDHFVENEGPSRLSASPDFGKNASPATGRFFSGTCWARRKRRLCSGRKCGVGRVFSTFPCSHAGCNPAGNRNHLFRAQEFHLCGGAQIAHLERTGGVFGPGSHLPDDVFGIRSAAALLSGPAVALPSSASRGDFPVSRSSRSSRERQCWGHYY